MSEEEDKDAKTEDPTSKKLEDAIKKGQIAQSKELNSFFMFLFFTIIAIWTMPLLMKKFTYKLQYLIANSGTIAVDNGQVYNLLKYYMQISLLYLSPIFIGLFVAAFISYYMQAGTLIFTFEQMTPDLSKLSITKGLKRLFSMKNLMEFLKGIFKIVLIGTFVLMVIKADIYELSQYQELSIVGIMLQLKMMVNDILMIVTIIMAAIAIVDFSYQKYEHFNNLKMSKHEIKEEYKQSEGNPEIKSKMKQLRQEQSKKRIKDTVPTARVVITNPEHYAVALSYEDGSDEPPICVAKGLDLIAQKIKDIAREHSIVIVEDPPLARTLFKDVAVDEEIPLKHYEAVAKIISYVISIEEERRKKKRNG